MAATLDFVVSRAASLRTICDGIAALALLPLKCQDNLAVDSQKPESDDDQVARSLFKKVFEEQWNPVDHLLLRSAVEELHDELRELAAGLTDLNLYNELKMSFESLIEDLAVALEDPTAD